MQPASFNTNTHTPEWKDAALAKAEVITDAWEVVKAYAGRAAEWVLFLCMIVNIIEMLPGVSLPAFMTNTVLGVQVVMLDIGGMSLSSMAAHIRALGDAEGAKKADITSKFLIGLMIVTLLLVSTGLLFPMVKQYTDIGEKGLILVRVVMTVIYGHVIHSLRSSNRQVPVPPAPQPIVPESTELQALIRNILVPVLEKYHTDTKSDVEEQVKRTLAGLARQKQEETRQDDLPALPGEAQQKSPKHTQKMYGKGLLQLPAPVSIEGGKQDRQARLEAAYRELVREGVKPTGQTLSSRARCNRAVALAWMKQCGGRDENAEIEEVNQA